MDFTSYNLLKDNYDGYILIITLLVIVIMDSIVILVILAMFTKTINIIIPCQHFSIQYYQEKTL